MVDLGSNAPQVLEKFLSLLLLKDFNMHITPVVTNV